MANELEVMRSAGLTEAESVVYLALLELGSSTAGPVIKKTGMHRATVYDALRKLMEKGFASFVIKGKKKNFEAADPKNILNSLSEREREFKKMLPRLLSRKELARAQQEVVVYEGTKGIWIVMQNILEELKGGGEYYNFGVSGLFRSVMGKNWDRWQKRKKKLGIRAYCIFDAGVKERDPYLVQNYVGKKKFHPPHYRSLTDTLIYKDKVVMFIWSAKPPIAVVIRNKENALGYKNQFLFMWKHATR